MYWIFFIMIFRFCYKANINLIKLYNLILLQQCQDYLGSPFLMEGMNDINFYIIWSLLHMKLLFHQLSLFVVFFTETTLVVLIQCYMVSSWNMEESWKRPQSPKSQRMDAKLCKSTLCQFLAGKLLIWIFQNLKLKFLKLHSSHSFFFKYSCRWRDT